MSASSDLKHLFEVAGALQSRHNFTKEELETNRGSGSRVAAIALERAFRLSPAALGRIFCALPKALLWADYTKVWTIESVLAHHHKDEVMILQLKVALILVYALGAPLGTYAGDGWGDASTGFEPSAEYFAA